MEFVGTRIRMRDQSGGKLKKISVKSKNFYDKRGLLWQNWHLLKQFKTVVISLKPIMANFVLIASVLNRHN